MATFTELIVSKNFSHADDPRVSPGWYEDETIEVLFFSIEEALKWNIFNQNPESLFNLVSEKEPRSPWFKIKRAGEIFGNPVNFRGEGFNIVNVANQKVTFKVDNGFIAIKSWKHEVAWSLANTRGPNHSAEILGMKWFDLEGGISEWGRTLIDGENLVFETFSGATIALSKARVSLHPALEANLEQDEYVIDVETRSGGDQRKKRFIPSGAIRSVEYWWCQVEEVFRPGDQSYEYFLRHGMCTSVLTQFDLALVASKDDLLALGVEERR